MATDRELIHNWRLAKLRLDRAKKDEMRWRTLIAIQLFPNVEIGTNWYKDEVKLVAKENYTLHKSEEFIKSTLQSMWQEFEDERQVIEELVQWKPSFKEPVYRNLTDEAKNVFAAVLTIKEAAPAVSLKGETE
jgi:hypothetical protein